MRSVCTNGLKPQHIPNGGKIAWRETRASSGRFLFVILAVAAGVGSLTGVRGFSRAFHTMLQRDARSFMAADLTVRTFQPADAPQQAEMIRLAKRGIEHTQITETLTMASPTGMAAPAADFGEGGRPRRVSVLWHRETRIRRWICEPRSRPMRSSVADGVLLRLNAKVGDTIRIGGQPFRIMRRSHQRA